MQAGKLRKRVVIQALPAEQAVDPQWNEPTFGDWAAVATVWANISPLSGRELVFAGQVAGDATHMVTVRYYRGLTAKMRFQYTDDRTSAVRYFNIVYVKDVEEKHREMDCFCQESVA